MYGCIDHHYTYAGGYTDDDNLDFCRIYSYSSYIAIWHLLILEFKQALIDTFVCVDV